MPALNSLNRRASSEVPVESWPSGPRRLPLPGTLLAGGVTGTRTAPAAARLARAAANIALRSDGSYPSRAPLRASGLSVAVKSLPAGRWLALAAVAASLGSGPAMAPSTKATSVTLRPIGPGVSNDAARGMTPARLTRPTVGLTPTRELASLGPRMLPWVSLPMVAAAKAMEPATPDPDEE